MGWFRQQLGIKIKFHREGIIHDSCKCPFKIKVKEVAKNMSNQDDFDRCIEDKNIITVGSWICGYCEDYKGTVGYYVMCRKKIDGMV